MHEKCHAHGQRKVMVKSAGKFLAENEQFLNGRTRFNFCRQRLFETSLKGFGGDSA
jgi:hypothetical protein